MMKKQKMGIEVEMTGLQRREIAKIVADHFDSVDVYEGGSYDKWTVKDGQGRKWQIVRDASIMCEQKIDGIRIVASSLYSVELVTPILKYDDLENYQELIRKIRKAGAFVNKSCGIHIHVDGANHNIKSLKNLVNMMTSREEMIYKSLQVRESRIRYAKQIRPEISEKINKCTNMEDLKNLWYEGRTYESNRHYSQYRYYGLNFHSLWTIGTVEFRMFNATLHAGRIKAYIQLCLGMSARCIKATRISNKKPVDQVSENHNFRCFFV